MSDAAAHAKALADHAAGPAGVPAPVAPGAEHLVKRVPRGDPLPDAFVAIEAA